MSIETITQRFVNGLKKIGHEVDRRFTQLSVTLDLSGYTPEEERFARRVLSGEMSDDLKDFYRRDRSMAFVPGPGWFRYTAGFSFSTGVDWVAGFTPEQVQNDMINYARGLVGYAYDLDKPPVFGR